MSQLDSLAKIFSLVQVGLGQPADPSFLLQVKRAVHEACAFYMTDLIQSDQNQIVKKSGEIPFVNNQCTYSLASITDMTMPDWVEVKQRSNQTTDEINWSLVTVVNRDSLPLYQDRTELACAFYSDLPSGTRYIEWSYIPFIQNTPNNCTFRIWYDPHIVVNTGDNEGTNFPPEYNYLIAADAKMRVLPYLIGKAMDNIPPNTDRYVMRAIMGNWQTIEAQIARELQMWEQKWRFYKLASRTNQGGGVRKSIIPTYL